MTVVSGRQEEIHRIPLLFVTQDESLDSSIDRRSAFYREQARQVPPDEPRPQALVTIPNVLTFFRLVLVPVLMSAWYSELKFAPLLCGVLFILAALTDWLDGYLARRWKIVTVFGAFLDPVADKIMVATALILLATSPPAPLNIQKLAPPVVIIICREITMSALREWAAAAGGGAHKAVKVNSLGKWKTALQMTAMSIMLLCRDQEVMPGLFHHTGVVAVLRLVEMELVEVSFWLLWAAAGLAVWSLGIYMSNVWNHFVYPTVQKKQH